MKPWRLRPGAVIMIATLGLAGYISGSGGSSPSTSGPSQLIKIKAPLTSTGSPDPITATSSGSMLLAFNVCGSLAIMTKKGMALSLAKSIEPSATADEWTVTLCDGFAYPDGTATAGQDILDSLSHFAQSPNCAALCFGVDFEASSVSESVAALKPKKPASDFLESSLGMFFAAASKGKFTGIGAGPFVVDKGGPDIGYQLHASDEYQNGAPSIPQVTVVPIPNSTAQANALRTGEIDLAISPNSAALTILSGAPNIKVTDATLEFASALELAPNTRIAPFNDPEVRCAAKLAVNRDKLVSTILGSTSEVVSNMLGRGYDNYPEDVAQTVANKEEAKHIFAEKGVIPFTTVAASIMPDMVPSAELMAQEFAEVGVQVTADKRDPQTYYNNLKKLHQARAATVFWINRNPITEFRSQVMPDYLFNLSDFTSETIQQNLAKAIAILDAAEQEKLVGEISKEIHGRGGNLIRGYQKRVSAYRAGLENFTSIQSAPWLTKTTFNPVG